MYGYHSTHSKHNKKGIKVPKLEDWFYGLLLVAFILLLSASMFN